MDVLYVYIYVSKRSYVGGLQTKVTAVERTCLSELNPSFFSLLGAKPTFKFQVETRRKVEKADLHPASLSPSLSHRQRQTSTPLHRLM